MNCIICHLEHIQKNPPWAGCLEACLIEIIRLRGELETTKLRERAALGQAMLAQQSAHELGDKLRAMQAEKLTL